MNTYNIRFQSQQMSICDLKKNIMECYDSILGLVVKPEFFDLPKAELFLKRLARHKNPR